MTTTSQPDQAQHPAAPEPASSPHAARSIFDPAILRAAIWPSFAKLDPRVQIRNPVMFVVEIGAAITTVAWLIQALGGGPLGGGDEPWWFTFTVAVWLWLTVLFANFAEALAEGRGKAQAAALRALRTDTMARLRDGTQNGPPSCAPATSWWSRRASRSRATAP
jgi:K+-transporting ATPase ATPase B chain